MKIIVSGGAGFIGSNLCNRFEEKGINYMTVDNLQFGYVDNLKNKDKFIPSGIEELQPTFLNQFDVLIHCACANIIYSQFEHIKSFETNALNSFYLFRNFKGKIIYTSTSSVYGQANILPTDEDQTCHVSNAYDQSKLLSELYLQLRGNQTTLRLSNVYGRNQRPDYNYSGVIGKLIGNARNKQPFEITGDGLATRDYTYIDDVLDAIELAIEKPTQDRPINIGTCIETNSLKLAYMIAGIMQVPFNVKFIPNRSIDHIQRRCLNICCAKELLGWTPKVQIYEGIERTIKEMKK